MKDDPLNEAREIRQRISQEVDNDPERVFEFYRRHQEESKASGRFSFVKPTAQLGSTHRTLKTL